MDPDRELIRRCIKQDLKAQEEFYRRFAPNMFGVCLRLANNETEAKDLLHDGFIRIFKHLKDFRFEGPLEGWIRKTIVNTAINYLKQKSKAPIEINSEKVEYFGSVQADIIEAFSAEELLALIQQLPPLYRIVFNLNVIEGYFHDEIGKLLNIPENTSKSYLLRARLLLQDMINQRK